MLASTRGTSHLTETVRKGAAHKKLVIKMKNMITTEPQKYHYIRDGKIHSVDKRTENENVS